MKTGFLCSQLKNVYLCNYTEIYEYLCKIDRLVLCSDLEHFCSVLEHCAFVCQNCCVFAQLHNVNKVSHETLSIIYIEGVKIHYISDCKSVRFTLNTESVRFFLEVFYFSSFCGKTSLFVANKPLVFSGLWLKC